MIFKQSPTAINYCRSPLMYWVYEATNPNSYDYGLDVWIWTGSTTPSAQWNYRLRRTLLEDDTAIFDISKLVQSFFNNMEYFSADGTGMIVNIKAAAFLWDGDEPDPSDKTHSAVSQSTYGFLHPWDDLDYDPSCGSGNYFMTDVPDISVGVNIYPDQPYTVSVIRLSTSTPTHIRIADDNSNTHDILLGTSYSTAEERMETHEVGRDVLAGHSIAPTLYYDVYLWDGAAQVGDEIRFYIKDECKYGADQIIYLNRYGAWDYINVSGLDYEELKVTGNDYMVGGLDYSDGVSLGRSYSGQIRVHHKEGNHITTVNTGWINEDFDVSIRQMFLSEHIIYHNQPVRLESKTVEYKKTVKDKLMNYTFKFRYAYNIINNLS